ncbi:STY0301 family protein [Massilia sp. PWRC2]|uniref:STY0301 family protein n=1 Tax=Massilia sp. PWRC2 TaxID=2804626 RepID=UPI003CF3E104
MTATRLVPLIAVVWAAAGAFAADMTAQCPGIIPVTTIKPDKAVAGWTTVVPGPMHLRGAGMLSGAPETKRYLVPDKDAKGIQTYRVARGDGERWVWCDYGAVELARKLDDSATSCVVTTKIKTAERFVSAVVACK